LSPLRNVLFRAVQLLLSLENFQKSSPAKYFRLAEVIIAGANTEQRKTG
jgi:hypothetical protein